MRIISTYKGYNWTKYHGNSAKVKNHLKRLHSIQFYEQNHIHRTI